MRDNGTTKQKACVYNTNIITEYDGRYFLLYFSNESFLSLFDNSSDRPCFYPCMSGQPNEGDELKRRKGEKASR